MGEKVEVYVTAKPSGNEANSAVIESLAKALHVAKSNLTLIRGHKSRLKVIDVQGLTAEQALDLLSH